MARAPRRPSGGYDERVVRRMGCGASTTAPPKGGEPALQTMRTDSKGNVVKHNSYEEWQKKTAAKKLAAALATEEGRNELKALYESLDGDGDGKLNAEEWSTGLAANAKIVGKYFGGVSAQ